VIARLKPWNAMHAEELVTVPVSALAPTVVLTRLERPVTHAERRVTLPVTAHPKVSMVLQLLLLRLLLHRFLYKGVPLFDRPRWTIDHCSTTVHFHRISSFICTLDIILNWSWVVRSFFSTRKSNSILTNITDCFFRRLVFSSVFLDMHSQNLKKHFCTRYSFPTLYELATR